jgi:hypothetical protein
MPITALDWLKNKIESQSSITKNQVLDLILEAKSIERYQIMDAYDLGWHQSGQEGESSEKYYREYYTNIEEQDEKTIRVKQPLKEMELCWFREDGIEILDHRLDGQDHLYTFKRTRV